MTTTRNKEPKETLITAAIPKLTSLALARLLAE